MLSSLESFPFHLRSYFSFGKTRRRSTSILSAVQAPAAEAGPTFPRGCPPPPATSHPPRTPTCPPEGLLSLRRQQEGDFCLELVLQEEVWRSDPGWWHGDAAVPPPQPRVS